MTMPMVTAGQDPPGGDIQGRKKGRGSVPATRPATDYTARLIPHRPGVAVPFEAARILWQR